MSGQVLDLDDVRQGSDVGRVGDVLDDPVADRLVRRDLAVLRLELHRVEVRRAGGRRLRPQRETHSTR